MDVLKTVPEMESTLRKSFGDEDGSLLKSTIGATKVEELFERAIASRRSAIDELKKKLEGSPDGSLSSLMNEAEIEALLKATEALQEYADKQAQAFELVEMTDSAKKKLLETEELNKLLTEARIPLDSAQAAQLRTSIGLLIDYEDEVEAANKALEEGIRAREGVVQAQVAASQTVRDQIDLLNEEAYLMGLSANQREIESRVLQAQSSYREVGTVLMSEEADELRSLGAELIRVREAQEEVNQELGKAQALQQANRDLVTQAIEGAQRLERRARLEILTLNLTNEAKERALVLDGLREASGDADSPELENALANLDRQLERLDTLEQLKEVADGIGEAFGQAFEKVILGTGSVRDAVKAMLQDIMQQLLRTLVTQQIVQGISSGISGLGGGGTGAGKPKVLAMGGVLSRGNIVPFASGGVVGSPMFFPLQGGKTGLMGEAGPEAIMPLSRGPGGKLGVRAEGGRSVVVNMTVNARDAKSFIQSKRQIGTMLRRMGDA